MRGGIIPYDINSVAQAVAANAAVGSARGVIVGGIDDGGLYRPVNISALGAARIRAGGAPSSPVDRSVLGALKDGAGNLRAILVSNKGVAVSLSMPQAIEHGVVSGLTGFVYGRRANMTSSLSPQSFAQSTYTEPTTSSQWNVLSSSASDAAAGTGARKVKITYYKESAGIITGPFSEIVTLNGITAVNMVETAARFLEDVRCVEFGTGALPVGSITVRTAANATIYAHPASQPDAYIAHHYVTNARTCFVNAMFARTNVVSILHYVRTKNPFVSDAALIPQGFVCSSAPSDGTADTKGFNFTTEHNPLRIAGPAYIQYTAQQLSTSLATQAQGCFSFFEY